VPRCSEPSVVDPLARAGNAQPIADVSVAAASAQKVVQHGVEAPVLVVLAKLAEAQSPPHLVSDLTVLAERREKLVVVRPIFGEGGGEPHHEFQEVDPALREKMPDGRSGARREPEGGEAAGRGLPATGEHLNVDPVAADENVGRGRSVGAAVGDLECPVVRAPRDPVRPLDALTEVPEPCHAARHRALGGQRDPVRPDLCFGGQAFDGVDAVPVREFEPRDRDQAKVGALRVHPHNHEVIDLEVCPEAVHGVVDLALLKSHVCDDVAHGRACVGGILVSGAAGTIYHLKAVARLFDSSPFQRINEIQFHAAHASAGQTTLVQEASA
jgi:hypothetical protein